MRMRDNLPIPFSKSVDSWSKSRLNLYKRFRDSWYLIAHRIHDPRQLKTSRQYDDAISWKTSCHKPNLSRQAHPEVALLVQISLKLDRPFNQDDS